MSQYETELAHLVKMASDPGFKAHAWHRAQELEKCSSGQWDGIATALQQEMAALKSVESSSAPRKAGE